MIDLTKTVAAVLVVVAMVYVCYKTISFAQRNLASLVTDKNTLSVMRSALIIIATTVGIVLSSITWKLSENQSIVGLPLPWSIWDDTNSYWENFISPLSVLPWGADLIFGFALPHLPIAIICAVRKRKLPSVCRRAR